MINWMIKASILSFACVWWLANSAVASPVKTDEQIIFFPTNAYWDDGWVLPLRGWVFEYERGSLWRRGSLAILERSFEVNHSARKNPFFKERAWMFLVDNERNKQIKVDVGGKVYSLDTSKPNGHFKGRIKLRTAKAERIADNGDWISYEAVLPGNDGRVFKGEVQLLYSGDVSVISDIDDTIKISRVARKKKLIRNTFLKQYRPVPGMARLYLHWAKDGASFHYVSGSPWQLYQPLKTFMDEAGFPKGSFALRHFRVKDSSFVDFLKQPKKQKTRAIQRLLDNFPDRRFVLVGDSTESDPEIYSEFARSHSEQVHHILIRDVKDRPMTNIRIKAVFAGIDSTQWTIFKDAEELLPVNAASR